MNFEYSTNATDLASGTWTGVAALNFVTPDTATGGAKNGNAAADRTALSSTISGLSIPNGATFWIRWNDQDASGADDGLAIDDFSLTPLGVTAAAPSISGRVRSALGGGIARAVVTIEGGGLAGPRAVVTDAFGYYKFDEVPAGQTYNLTVRAKLHHFAEPTRVVSMLDEITGFDFVTGP